MIAVYCRVSTEEQTRNETIQNQIDFAQKYAELHQLGTLVFFTDESISGVIPLEDRTGGQDLMDAVRRGQVSEVLLHRLDRLGRSARVILNAVHVIEQHGVRVRSMTEPFDTQDPTGRFLLTILAGVADLERETIKERTQAGIFRAVANGVWPGPAPFGYKKNDDGTLTPDETPINDTGLTPAGVVRMIFHLVGNQGYTTVQVVNYLNSLGIPAASIIQRRKNKAKSGWTPPPIYRITTNPLYIGEKVLKYKDQRIECKAPPLIEIDLWYRTRDVVAEHSRNNWYKPTHRYLLTGLVICGNCGRKYSGRSVKRYLSGGREYMERHYLCGSKRYINTKNCGNPNVNADKLENDVWNRVLSFLNNPGPALEGMIKNVPDGKELCKEKEIIEHALKSKDKERQQVLDLYRRGFIAINDVEEQMSRMTKEREELTGKLRDVHAKIKNQENISARVKELTRLLKLLRLKTEKALSWEAKRKIVMMLVKGITIYPGPPGKKYDFNIDYYFNPAGTGLLDHAESINNDTARNLITSSEIDKLRAIVDTIEGG